MATIELVDAGLLGHACAAVGYLFLTLLVAYWWRRDLSGALLIASSLATAAWAAITAYSLRVGGFGQVAEVLDLCRTGGWMLLSLSLLFWMPQVRRLAWASVIAGTCISIAALAILFGGVSSPEGASDAQMVAIIGHLALAITGLALVENLYRNSSPARRWSVKYLCFGAGAMFAYDFFFYSDTLLFRHLDVGLFLARGIANLLVLPLLGLYAVRNRKGGPQIAVSRQFVFHSTTIVGAGLYLITMAAAGYYVRQFGGTWSTFLQALFFFGAVLLLIVPLSSSSVRAYLRVFIEKSFFQYKYDYRQEWLGFIRTISQTQEGQHLRRRVIQAICDIVESPEGALWLQRDAGTFSLAAAWNTSRWNLASRAVIKAEGPLALFLNQTKWIIDTDQYRKTPERYAGLKEMPEWLSAVPRAWLIVPLVLDDKLYGILILGYSRAERQLSWEDFDILKTVGQQAASYLAQQEADEALVEARQFEAFNKRFAFVVHDIKNLVSQLSLVLTNAAKHRSNVDFQNDALETVRQSIDKLNKMLRQLRAEPPRIGPQQAGPSKSVELAGLLGDIVAHQKQHHGGVSLNLQKPTALVAADEDRLKTIVEHLIQNALDAAGTQGSVEVRLADDGDMAAVEIEDNGPGMDPTFVRDRLFRPFDTTKDSGYGIGVYESREYARSLGGRLEVHSEPGRGTVMRFCLPMVDAE